MVALKLLHRGTEVWHWPVLSGAVNIIFFVEKIIIASCVFLMCILSKTYSPETQHSFGQLKLYIKTLCSALVWFLKKTVASIISSLKKIKVYWCSFLQIKWYNRFITPIHKCQYTGSHKVIRIPSSQSWQAQVLRSQQGSRTAKCICSTWNRNTFL